MNQPEYTQKNTVGGDIINSGTVIVGENNTVIHAVEKRLPKELTQTLLRDQTDGIIGRENDLAQLYESLHTQKRVVVVNGLGGIGKTTLAQAYVSRFYDYYHHIAWITQGSDNIASDFVNTAGLVKNLNIDVTGLDSQQLFEEMIRQLKAIPSQPNLLVIDNGEPSLQHYLHQLPGQPHWHLLVTSREAISGFHHQTLGFLEEEQAVALFKRHYTHHRLSDKDIKELVMLVDYHTLTIEMLAKTAEVQRYDLASLRQTIEQDLRANIEDIPHARKKGKIEKIGSYLRTVFTLSRLSPEEIWLLQQFACLPAEFHSYDLLRELLIDENDTHAEPFSETLSQLAKKGWLLHDSTTDKYKMHRIIADVIRKEQPIHLIDISALLGSITQRLHLDQNKDNPIDKFPWIPFGKALLVDCAEDPSPKVGQLQNNLGLRFQSQGDFATAKVLLERSLDSAEKNFGPDHSTTAIRYSSLGIVLKDLGDYAAAKILLEKALQSDEKNLGPDHPNTAISYSNLALALKEIGDLSGAKALLEKTVLSAEKNLGPDHPTTTIGYSNLATVLQDLGDLSGAKTLLEKAILSDEKNFGPDHPNTAIRYSNLALVLKDLGEYPTARTLLEKAMLSDEKNFGPDHPSTAIRYSNLATVLQDLGDLSGAKALLEKAMFSDEKSFGTGHPITAIRYSNLAIVLQDLGDYAAAKTLLEKAVLSDEKNFGPDHPSTAIRYSNLATVLQDLGDLSGAKTLLEKAILSDEKNLGPDHPSIAIRYSNLALVLNDLGDYPAAKTLLEKAMLSDEKNLGVDHPNTAIRYSNLAIVLENMGDYLAAKTLLEKAIRSNEKNLGPDHPSMALRYSKLANILQRLGDHDQALHFVEKARMAIKKKFPEGHSYTNLIENTYQSIKNNPPRHE